ncbi:MAG TPA: peptidylprolyl isomerase [Acidobacteriota bacterium]|nr:peptidylprolyl isomerase [Acidobacteriota bacterium]
MAALKKGDFVTVSYTGRLPNTEVVFDTTDAAIAKKAGIFSDKKTYAAPTVCIGEFQILEGIDAGLVGKNENSTFKVELSAENAFGKRKPELIKFISFNKFQSDRINPFPGLQVVVDGQIGVVKSVTGGRVMVDFNHPLSGKDVEYDVHVGTKVTDTDKQLQALVSLQFKGGEATLAQNKATITLPLQMPKEHAAVFEAQIKRMIPAIQSVTFAVKAPAK